MPDRNRPLSLVQLLDRFNSDDVCKEYLEKLRWPSEVGCPRCGSVSVSVISTRDQWDCNDCRYRFSVTSGTIFDNTKLPLRTWFAAIFLLTQSKKGMSAKQIQRTLAIGSYKTAWHLCHRVREAMESGNMSGPTLFGVVEVDETWMNDPRGRQPWDKRKRPPQLYIAGAIQRGGQVRIKRVPDLRSKTLKAFIREHVKDEADAIYTDALRSYVGIGDENTKHEIISHEWEWVRGDVHTNSIEGVWSLFKRSIMGAFHHISVKHLDRYLEELEWRFNNRDNPFIFRDLLTRLMGEDPLRYRELTG